MKKALGPLIFAAAAIASFALPYTTLTAPVLLFLATWLALRLDGRRLSDLRLTAWRQLGTGIAAGVVLFSGIALVQGLAAGSSWQFHPEAIVGVITLGAGMVLLSVLFEELLFRGYAFQRLQTLGGPAIALAVTSLAFGAYHLIGHPYWAIGAVFQFLMPTLGGLVFGYALLRSRGLSLPIGLHWGGNFAMLCLFGFNTGSATLWSTQITDGQVRSLIAPDLLPHLPYLTALALMVALVWRTARKPVAAS